MPYLVGYITPQDYGAVGNGVTDDTAAINAAMAAANAVGGATVYLGDSVYLVSSQLSLPPYVQLVGQLQVSLNLWTTPPTNMARILVSSSWAPASTSGVIAIQSKTPGGWSQNNESCSVQNVVIDCSQNTSTNVSAIWINGPVYDVHLQDVFLFEAGHNGVHASGQTEAGITPTFPYHQRYTRVSAVRNGNVGFNLANFTDSTYVDCLSFNNTSYGWVLNNVGNTLMVGCRAEWATSTTTGRGFNITGGVGELTMSGCETDQNACEGLYINATTVASSSGGGIVIAGMKCHGDGNGGTNTNGVKITNSLAPVAISGLNVSAALNGASYWPTTGLEVDTSSNVVVSGSIIQGITSSWVDGGGNTLLMRRGCFGATGDPGAQVYTVLPELPATNIPLPEDQNLIGWTFDPASQFSNSSPSTGVVYLNRINVRTPTKITNVLLDVITLGSTLTAAENFAGLYNGSGTLLSATADQTANWGSTGLKTMALTTAQTVTPGIYYLAFLSNGTTAPLFARATSQGSSALNAGTTSATPRYATSGTTQTTLPSTITITGAAISSDAWWGAFS